MNETEHLTNALLHALAIKNRVSNRSATIEDIHPIADEPEFDPKCLECGEPCVQTGGEYCYTCIQLNGALDAPDY